MIILYFNDINLKDTYYDLELENDISSNTNCIIVMISAIQGPRNTILESFTKIGETGNGKSSFVIKLVVFIINLLVKMIVVHDQNVKM